MSPDLLLHPAVQSGVIPFCVAALVAAALHIARLGGLAQFAVLLAYLAAHAVVFGWPAFPPVASTQKLAYVAAACLAGGLVAGQTAGTWRRWAAATVLFLGCAAWIAAPRLTGDGADWALATLVAGATVLALALLARAPEDGIEGGVAVLAAAVGLGLVALLGGSASIFQSALALAAGLGGFLVWNWPRRRHPAATVALFATALLGVLCVQMVFFTRASGGAAAALLPIFALPLLLPRPRRAAEAWRGPMLVGAATLLPAAGAILIALAQGGSAYTG